MGDKEICPNPTSEAAQARIFNNVGAMLNETFRYARAKLGFKTAVGTEAPRNAFFIQSMGGGAAAAQSTYEAVFQRIERAYPIDYWWTWTPEGFIWNEGNLGYSSVCTHILSLVPMAVGSSSPVGTMIGAPVLASSCPTSPSAGEWQNTWTLVNSSSASKCFGSLSFCSH